MDPIFAGTETRQLCDIVRSLVEEWGAEHFEIQLPQAWASWSATAVHHAVRFVTEDSVIIIVGDGKMSFRREVKLAPGVQFSRHG